MDKHQEELSIKCTQFIRMVARLEYMATKWQCSLNATHTDSDDDDEENESAIYRDALIKRFQLCYILNWDVLRFILKVHYSADINSIRKVLDICYARDILSASDVQDLKKIMGTYKQIRYETVGIVSKKIVGFVDFLQKLAAKYTQYQ